MLLNLSVSLWSWPLFARDLVFEKTTGLFLVRLCYVGAIFIPPLFFHFVSSLLKQERTRLIAAFYLLRVIFLTFDFTPLFIKDVGPILSFRHYGVPGPVPAPAGRVHRQLRAAPVCRAPRDCLFLRRPVDGLPGARALYGARRLLV